jgi:DNA-binding ferritin-like protein (Dps family)
MTIAIEADAYTDKDLEEMVDEDIANFDKFFQSLGNDPLSSFEKAAIKTYLWYKTHGESSAKDMNKLRQVLDGVCVEQAPVHGATNGESDGA